MFIAENTTQPNSNNADEDLTYLKDVLSTMSYDDKLKLLSFLDVLHQESTLENVS